MVNIEFLRQIVGIDSTPNHGTRELVEFLAHKAHEMGLSAEIHAETFDGADHANIIISKNKRTKTDELVFLSDLDTRNPGDYGRWVRNGANPFNASIVGDEIFGLGVTNKSDFVAKLFALKEAKIPANASVQPVIVGTFGQESLAGALKLIRKKLIQPKGVIVTAPTDLKIANKGRGFAEVELRIPFSDFEKKYRAEHDDLEGGFTQSKLFVRKSGGVGLEIYDNPILRLIDYLGQLPEGVAIMTVDAGVSPNTEPDSAYLEFDLVGNLELGITKKLIQVADLLKSLSAELKSVQDKDFMPNHSSITLGRIRTSAEEIVLNGTCGLIPSATRERYEEWLEKLRQDVAQIGASMRILNFKGTFLTDSGGPFFGRLKKVSSQVGIQNDFGAAMKCSEANVFNRLGIETAVFGPGRVWGDEQSTQEHVSLNDVDKAQKFYGALIGDFCK